MSVTWQGAIDPWRDAWRTLRLIAADYALEAASHLAPKDSAERRLICGFILQYLGSQK